MAVILLDWLFVAYATSHGFEVKVQALNLGINVSVPLHLLPVIGIALVSLVGWYDLEARIFPRRVTMEVDPLARLRLVRVIVFSLLLFVLVLYVPYLIGSNWFWARMSEASRSISQLRDVGLSILRTSEPAMLLNPLWQYSLSQVLASGAMLLSAAALGRVARRPRKPR